MGELNVKNLLILKLNIMLFIDFIDKDIVLKLNVCCLVVLLRRLGEIIVLFFILFIGGVVIILFVLGLIFF